MRKVIALMTLFFLVIGGIAIARTPANTGDTHEKTAYNQPLLIETTSAALREEMTQHPGDSRDKRNDLPVVAYYYSPSDKNELDQELVIQQATQDWYGYFTFYKNNADTDADPGSEVSDTPMLVMLSHDNQGKVVVLNVARGPFNYTQVRDFMTTGQSHQQVTSSSITNGVKQVRIEDLDTEVGRNPAVVVQYIPGSLLSEMELQIVAAENAKLNRPVELIAVEVGPGHDRFPLTSFYKLGDKVPDYSAGGLMGAREIRHHLVQVDWVPSLK